MTNWQPSEREPALVAHPRAASLDEAHLAIELWEFYARKSLDAEQKLAVELMLAESKDGRWAADTTGRAESRQNGKGDEIEVVELWGLTQRAEAILHTAHEAATAASAHARMIALVEGHRDLRVKVKKKQSWNGNYSLVLKNDGIIVWRTRTGAGGRGLDDISRIVVDEAQHAQPEELASSLPILSVNPNPQKNFMGSGGVAGKSGFWWRQRRRALTGGADRFSWLEHSAETVTIDAEGKIISTVGDIADPETWRRANPAYPSRISHDFLLDQLETLGPELFAREHLCVWDPELSTGEMVIPLDLWNARNLPGERGEKIAYAIDASPDGRSAAIAASDGRLVLVLEHAPGTAWLPPTLKAILSAKPGTVHLDPKSPAGALVVDLAEHGVEWTPITPEQHAQACGGFLAAVVEGDTLRHEGQPALDVAVKGATRRPYGDAWAWNRRSATVDICPLVAVTIARWAALSGQPDAPPMVMILGGS